MSIVCANAEAMLVSVVLVVTGDLCFMLMCVACTAT